MHPKSVEKFEDAVTTVLGEMRQAERSDVTGTAIAPEHEADVRRISKALLPLLVGLARTKHLRVADPNLVSQSRAASAKMFLDDNGDIVLPP
jgi:hypothetical protein